MPCCELFDKQSVEYKLTLFPDNIPVMSIEAASIYGWNKYAHSVIGMNTFGMSAPAEKVYDAFGFSVPQLVTRAEQTISHYHSLLQNGNTNLPSLVRLLEQHYVVPANSGH